MGLAKELRHGAAPVTTGDWLRNRSGSSIDRNPGHHPMPISSALAAFPERLANVFGDLAIGPLVRRRPRYGQASGSGSVPY